MAFDSTRFRETIRPEDSVAIAITLLGVAIAIFLGDTMIKFIGASIAFLGGMALFMTVRQRMNDQVQIRTRRSTLPPPAFKTRVATDPGTQTKRIFFDDFKETFDTGDDLDPIPATDDGESFTIVAKGDEARSSGAARSVVAEEKPKAVEAKRESEPALETAPAASEPARPATRHFDDDDNSDDDFDEVETSGFVAGDEGSFRVIKAAQPETPKQAAPKPGTSKPGASKPGAAKPAAKPAVQSPGESRPVPAKNGEAPAARPAEPEPREISTPPAAPAREETFEPVTLTAPVEEVQTERTPTRKQVQMMLDDLISDGEEEQRAGEPRSEFVRLVGQVLNAVARSMPARSIVFCWINNQKQHLIPEAQVTSGTYEIRTGARLPLGGDVISQIARSGIPEILTDISTAAERELIPYYVGPAETHSFVGVPVFFRHEVVGVLAADSSEENGFDEGDVATLAEYTRLIAGLIRGYTEKYDLHLTARTLDAFEQMHRAFTGTAEEPSKIARMLTEQIAGLFDSLYVGVALFDVARREWHVVAHASDPTFAGADGLVPDMSASAVGDCARFAEEIYLERIGGEVRLSPDEPANVGGSFLALPLVGTTKCYGAVVLEHSAPTAYIPRDIDLLRDLVRYAALAIEVYNVNQAIEAQSVLDESSGLFNTEFLLSTLDREILRARDFRKPLSFGLISIDMPASLRAGSSLELEEVVVTSVGEAITSMLRPYDVVGRYNAGTFGVILVERNDQDAYLWAERLRKEVASRIISVGGRKFSVTVSVGICDVTDLPGNGSVIAGASQALEKARGGDGNAVILY